MKKLITLVLLVLLSVVGCTGAPITISTQGGQPSIISFNAEQASISAGQSANLSWNVSGATTITIDQGIGNVALTGTRAVTPAATTIYTLTASSSAGTATATTQVVVTGTSAPPPTYGDLPVIVYFTASPSIVASGSPVTLTWSVSNASTVTIDNGIGTVGSTGSTVVTPASSISYTLTASNAAGWATSMATVLVGAAPPAGIADLVIQDIVRSGDTINYTIKNQGDATAGPTVSTLLVDGTTAANDNVGSLAPGQSSSESFASYTYSCTLPSDSIEVRADTGSAVVEGSEANNSSIESWACILIIGPLRTLKPDLVVEDIWVVGHTIHYRIKNQGIGASAAGYSRLYINDVIKGNDGVAAVAGGDSVDGSFIHNFDCALPILVDVKVTADIGGDSTETDETNNSRTETFSCP
ncbi:MAG TPA: CARDB domain-containing protein [Dehalococcoidia bacterium]